jgi:hypothetical protein
MVITAARVIEVDFRTMPVQNTQGTAFMCCFTSRRCLMGYKNTLWIMVADLHMIEPADTRSMHRRNLVVRFDIHQDNGKPFPSLHSIIYDKVGRYRNILLWCGIQNAEIQLVRLQRWFRRTGARVLAKRLALAMAWHPRLGCDSLLGGLDVDLARALLA